MTATHSIYRVRHVAKDRRRVLIEYLAVDADAYTAQGAHPVQWRIARAGYTLKPSRQGAQAFAQALNRLAAAELRALLDTHGKSDELPPLAAYRCDGRGMMAPLLREMPEPVWTAPDIEG